MYQYAVDADVFVDGKGTRGGGAALSVTAVAVAAAASASVDSAVLPAETLDAGCASDSVNSSPSRSSSPNGFRRTS